MFVRYVRCVGVVSMGQATLRGRGWTDGKWMDGWMGMARRSRQRIHGRGSLIGEEDDGRQAGTQAEN